MPTGALGQGVSVLIRFYIIVYVEYRIHFAVNSLSFLQVGRRVGNPVDGCSKGISVANMLT